MVRLSGAFRFVDCEFRLMAHRVNQDESCHDRATEIRGGRLRRAALWLTSAFEAEGRLGIALQGWQEVARD